MKTPQKSVYCSRCGDELSADEILQLDGSICALCEHIRAVALQIRKHIPRNSKPNVVRKLRAATMSSSNPGS